MTDLKSRLSELAERGTHLGAAELRQRVLVDLARNAASARHPVPGSVVAVAVAVIVIVVIGTPLILFGRSDGSIEPGGPVETASSSSVTVVEQPADTTVLVPVDGVDPLTMSTSIGEFEFVTMAFPDNRNFDFPFHEAVATPYGLVSADDSNLWWSSDSVTWNMVSTGGHLGTLVPVGDSIVGLAGTEATRYTWSRDRWAEGTTIEVPGSVDFMAFGPTGIVAANTTTVYYSLDGVDFTEAERGPDLGRFVASQVNPEEEEYVETARMDCRGTFGATESQISAVVGTTSGFVAFTSANHPAGAVCAPLLWFSSDGASWNLISPESPFGNAEVNTLSLAEHAGRFVAIGGVEAQERGYVWVSDDALTWRPADLELAHPLSVDAGELGWVLIGAAANSDFALWFSPDGETWDGPHPIPDGLRLGYLIPEIVVGSDTIFGVGYQEQLFVIGKLQAGRQAG